MNVKVINCAEEIGRAAAAMFIAQTLKNPKSVLGFATGSTPLPTYKALIGACNRSQVDFSKITTFNLDEYVGLPEMHEQSYRYFMMENLFNFINVNKANINTINGDVSDTDAACADFEKRIDDAGGIDLQILGIGNNGHIAFNEPDDHFPNITHKVDLHESTIEANKRFFESADEVPKSALTMGIGSIMRARQIVLIATGEGKAEAIKAAIRGPITPQCPASILQLHPCVTFLLDDGAASLL